MPTVPRAVLLGGGITASALAIAIAAVAVGPTLGPQPDSQPVSVERQEDSLPVPVIPASETLAQSASLASVAGNDEVRGFKFVVPASAPWSEFPDQDAAPEQLSVCTDAQLAWLRQNGFAAWDEVSVSFTNTAVAGAASTVKDIRAEGESSIAPAIVVFCPSPRGGESPLQVGLLSLGSGNFAVFDEQFLEGGGQAYEGGVYGEPGTPVLFNLLPGESSQLVLKISSAGLFTGRVVATVSSNEEDSYVVLADGFGLEKAAVLTGTDVFTVVIFGGFTCLRGSDYDPFTDPYDPANACAFSEIEGEIVALR